MEPLSLDKFWTWFEQHANCLTRVATPNTVLYDDESVHWVIGLERNTWVIQAIRGKRIAGEVLIDTSQLSHVLPLMEELDEHGFEAMSENEPSRSVACVFFFTHGFEEDEHNASVH